MATKQRITLERMCEVMACDPETGQFRWAGRRAHWCKKIGKVDVRPDRQQTPDDMSHARLVIGLDRRLYYAHKLMWLWVTGEYPEFEVDHKNGNGLDNRFCNLRPASGQQNKQNHRIYRNNKSGHTGVWWWDAQKSYQVHVSGKLIGYFKTKEEAHGAYERVSAEIFGEFKRKEELR